jgi:GT2 family glycosyltransferase
MLSTTNSIDFCICTYDRLAYLEKCIAALLPQLTDHHVLTVVDNSANGSAKEFISSLSVAEARRAKETHFSHLHYVHEPSPGLSKARNTGWKNSECEWIFYLDDDCLAPPDLVSETKKLISAYPSFDAFGGPIDPIVEGVLPDWIPEGFGKFDMPFQVVTELNVPVLRGGCFLVRRKILADLGGFDTSLGVTGGQLGYGEEMELQKRMLEKGFRLAYAPSLRVGHHVRAEKISLRWMLHSEYARRRDKMKYEPDSIGTASFHLGRSILSRLYHGPVNLGKTFLVRNYSFKRAMWETLKPLAYRWGELAGTFKRKVRSEK